jgi:hypothetical protein
MKSGQIKEGLYAQEYSIFNRSLRCLEMSSVFLNVAITHKIGWTFWTSWAMRHFFLHTTQGCQHPVPGKLNPNVYRPLLSSRFACSFEVWSGSGHFLEGQMYWEDLLRRSREVFWVFLAILGNSHKWNYQLGCIWISSSLAFRSGQMCSYSLRLGW